MTLPRPDHSSPPFSSPAPAHRSAHTIALCVVALGIALLAVVFVLAYELFRAPVPGLGLSATPSMATPPPATAIGGALTGFVRQMILLLIMTVAGSIITGKGIALYFSCGTGRS